MAENYVSFGLGYIGPTNENPYQASIRVEKDLDETEYLEIQEAATNVYGVIGARQFTIVQKNYLRIVNTVQFYENAVVEKKLSQHLNHRSIVENISVDIINWLTSTRLFLDHHLTSLAHRYGKKSPERDRFVAATKAEYDSVTAYRILYNLRDYTQHCGFPVDNITMTARDPDEDDWTAIVSLSANRDGLLEDFEWKSQPRADLLKMGETVDILTLINEAQPCFRRIFAELMRIRLDNCADSIGKVRNAAAHLESKTASKFLIKTTVTPGQPTTIMQSRLPIEICDWVEDPAALTAYMDRLVGQSNEDPSTQLSAPLLNEHTQNVIRLGARVMTAYFSAGGVKPEFMKATDAIIDADGDVISVLTGTVILCGMGTTMAGAALGTTPQDVIGGIVSSLDDQ